MSSANNGTISSPIADKKGVIYAEKLQKYLFSSSAPLYKDTHD